VSGLALVARRDFDLDRELQAAGLANLFGGAVGGTVGYHALSLSALALRTGGKQRAIGLVSIGVLLGAVVLGTTWFALVPRAILGGVLFFLGLSFLVEWLYDAWFKISRADYALIVAIVAVIATIGFLEGVVLGIAIAMVLFVVNYSRIHVVNYALTGLTYRSTVDRSPAQRATLRAHGDELLILQLQEFIFFGTAQRLLEYLQTRLNDHTRPALHFVVLDFRRVPGLDSSAVISFVRLKQLTEAEQVQLVLTHLSAPMQEQLLRGQVLGAVGGNVHTFPTLDHGVEWCENEMLQRAGHGADEPELLATQLQNVLGAADGMARLIQYMEFSEVPGGTRLIQQGDAADALYFIEYGSVSVELQLLNGKKTRLRTIRRGCVVGEVAMYTQGIRTASVETLEPSGIYRLSADALRRMETEEPMIASAVHKWVAQQIAERLSDNVRTLEVVMH
jgi:SulP family sulfate permease